MAILWELYGKGLGEAAGALEKTIANRRVAGALGGVDLSTPDGALQASKALIGMGRTQEGMTLAQLAMQERNRREELGIRREDQTLRRQKDEREGNQFGQSLGLQRDQLAQNERNQQQQRQAERERLDILRQQSNRREIPANFELSPDGKGLRPMAGGPADPAYKREVERTGKDPFEKINVDRIGELRTAADKSRDLLGNVEALEAARRGALATGGALRVPFIAGAVSGISPGNQTLDAAAAKFAGAAAEQLKGALSDKDLAFINKGVPGASMSDEAAKPIIEATRAGALRSRERSKFYETWYARTKSLDGADEAWDKFLNEKPIVSFGAKGQTVVNQGNVAAWKGYIPEKSAAAPRGASAGPGTAPPASQSRTLGPAPAGSNEGRTGTLPDGRKVVVRNGQLELAQ